MAVGASGVFGGVSGDEMRRVICFEGRKRGGGVRGWEKSSVGGSEPECGQTSACG